MKPDLTQCQRHGYALVSRAGNLFAWVVTIGQAYDYAERYPHPYTIVNVQNGTEIYVPNE